jgi:membrane protein implicated in regulation of membrane protease activity
LDTLDVIAIVAVIVVIVVIVGWYLLSIKWALFKKPLTGPESLIGKTGSVISRIERERSGEVNIDGVIWKATVPDDVEAHNSKLSVGETVVVVGYSSLTIVVRKAE